MPKDEFKTIILFFRKKNLGKNEIKAKVEIARNKFYLTFENGGSKQVKFKDLKKIQIGNTTLPMMDLT